MAEPIRILCVFSELDRGGAESMCMNLYRHIDRSKIQFDFIRHTPKKGAFEEEIISLGGRVFEAPQYKAYNHLSYCAWWKEHLKNHPEHKIIHGHYFTISAVYFKIAKKYGCKTIAHSHASYTAPSSFSGVVRRQLCKDIKKHSDFCIACSKQAGDWLFPPKGYTILANAIDTELFSFSSQTRTKVRENFNLSGKFVVGTVANIASVKNPYGTLEIIKALKKKEDDFRFLWIGGGGMWEELHQRVKDEHLQDTVIMTGARNDVHELLQAMDAFILPSFSEGLPVVVVEAQATGLPCYLADTITSEVVLTENCHRLPLGNPDRWMEEILKNKAMPRYDMSQRIVDSGYDIGTTAKWIEEFYLSLC